MMKTMEGDECASKGGREESPCSGVIHEHAGRAIARPLRSAHIGWSAELGRMVLIDDETEATYDVGFGNTADSETPWDRR